jgi:hypothetical protein
VALLGRSAAGTHPWYERTGLPWRVYNQEAVSGTVRPALLFSGMLKLRGLPFSCTKADIMEWFTDLPVAPIAADG